jgi:hypothetical protein
MPLNNLIAQLASAPSNNLTIPVDAPAPDTSSCSDEAAATSASASVVVSVTKVLIPVPPRTSSHDHAGSVYNSGLHDELESPILVIGAISDHVPTTYIRSDARIPLNPIIEYIDGQSSSWESAYHGAIQGGRDASALLWLVLSVLITIIYVLQPAMQFVRKRRKALKGS